MGAAIYGGILSLYLVWISRHFTSRIASRRSVWKDAVCELCGADLGPWRQLPLIGTHKGCSICGTSGSKVDKVLEWGSLGLGMTAGLLGGWEGTMIVATGATAAGIGSAIKGTGQTR